MASKQDRERLEESIPVLFGVVARQLLAKDQEPYVVSKFNIESNGTKAKRTMRVLCEAGYIRYRAPAPGVYEYGTRYRVDETKFKAESPALAAKAVDFSLTKLFVDVEGVLHENSWSYRRSSNRAESLDLCGQRKIGSSRYFGVEHSLNTPEALTVWWNRDDYVFNGGLNWEDCSEPDTVLLRSVHKEYLREVARAIVDVYVKHNLHILLPADMGLTRKGSPEDNISVRVHNFMHHETFLDDTHFKSMEHTYEEQLEYAQNMLRAYRAILKLRQEAGGLEPYMTHLRQAAIKRMVEEAPLCVCTKDEEGSLYRPTFKYGEMSRYVLQHLSAFDYDYLYGTARGDYLLSDKEEGTSPGINDDDAELLIKLWDEGETEEEDEEEE